MTRRSITKAERAQLWQRWRAGESMEAIARALERRSSSVRWVVERHGGIAPAVRRRSARSLSLREREEISRGIEAARTLGQIAEQINRPASTVSREIARNGGRARYRAYAADQAAWARTRRPKRCRLACEPRLCALVAEKLSARWSPQQIAGWLVREFPTDARMRVSHETIYRSLFIQARGVLKKQLLVHLRSRRVLRHPAQSGKSRRGQIIDAISIRARPAEAQERAIPGHWEGDLLCGGWRSQVATLVERHSRFVMLVKLTNKETSTVVAALSQHVQALPQELRRSLTWDRGLELAEHKAFTLATEMPVYFCDPKSPWQRGSNENTNGLLRQYLPKGADFSSLSQTQLDDIALSLNTRPRQTLGFRTPAETLNEALLR